jgi:hypothetical protein
MAALKTFDDPIDDTRTFQSKENTFPVDQLLRKHGFRIVSRKKDSEAIWSRANKEFTESGAVLLITNQEKEVL